jgi:hypothetical protein
MGTSWTTTGKLLEDDWTATGWRLEGYWPARPLFLSTSKTARGAKSKPAIDRLSKKNRGETALSRRENQKLSGVFGFFIGIVA